MQGVWTRNVASYRFHSWPTCSKSLRSRTRWKEAEKPAPNRRRCANIVRSHLASFVETLREAKRQGVNVALSRPSFELWLLLHHVEEAALRLLPSATVGQLNKTNLKPEHYPPASIWEA